MMHMLMGRNLSLISARSNKSTEMNHFFCSRYIMETKCGESTTQSCLFPLYLYPTEGEMQFEEGRRPNLKPEFIEAVSDKLGLKFVSDGKGDLKETFGPEDIFNYAYAVFHSPTYRSRYAEFLRIDFPHLPLTSDTELFQALAQKGAELVSLHLMEAPVLEQERTQIKFDVTGSNVVEKVTYDETAKRVYINKTQYFEAVPSEVWSFHFGGYQVAQKWLKDRKGRTLTYDELTHYQKVIVVLKETIRLMAEIDELIPGWPLE
jgi:predicted helicase